MKKLIILGVFSLSLLSTSQLVAEVNLTETLKAGKEIAQNICSGCHGVSGKAESGGNSGAVPNIYAQERDYLKIKLKEYNYNFNKAKRISEMEKEPAFKRAGVNLEDAELEKASRTSVSEDTNGEINLRTNNSFLHDNVD